MTEMALKGNRGREPDASAHPITVEPDQHTDTVQHDKRTEHMANERTHLAYLRTGISLITLGITVNRFSLYLQQHDALPSQPERVRLLGGTASAGVGMVVFALLLMLIALHRYRAVDEAIDRGTYHPDRPIVELLTVSVIIGAAAGILWMFRP
jgi:putative membrane protein